MPSEGRSPVLDISEAELLRHIIWAAEVEAVASEYPAHPQDCALDYSETHHRFVEVFRACRAVDAVGTEKRRDQFLVPFYRE